MNPQVFSPIGYVSAILGALTMLLWLVHVLHRPRGWWCHMALVVGIVAFVCAKINSVTYVNRIQLDRSEAMAAAQAKRDAARKAAEDARKDDVAQIRFAEDGSQDFLDKAGMDDADRKYLENAGKVPAWKQEKKQRSGGLEDDSLDAMLEAGTEPEEELDTEELGEQDEAKPVVMVARDMQRAHRLDALNLNWIRILILLGVAFVAIDYMQRLNVYEEAYLPLPLPSAWVNGMRPAPAAWARPRKPRRTMPEELTWFVRRGDPFVYVTDEQGKAAKVPENARRLGGAVDVIRADEGNTLVDDVFVFEGLWYNRASFLIDSAKRAEAFLGHLIEQLRDRLETRARVRQTVHLVWDLAYPIPAESREELVKLAGAMGWSILETREPDPE